MKKFGCEGIHPSLIDTLAFRVQQNGEWHEASGVLAMQVPIHATSARSVPLIPELLHQHAHVSRRGIDKDKWRSRLRQCDTLLRLNLIFPPPPLT